MKTWFVGCFKKIKYWKSKTQFANLQFQSQIYWNDQRFDPRSRFHQERLKSELIHRTNLKFCQFVMISGHTDIFQIKKNTAVKATAPKNMEKHVTVKGNVTRTVRQSTKPSSSMKSQQSADLRRCVVSVSTYWLITHILTDIRLWYESQFKRNHNCCIRMFIFSENTIKTVCQNISAAPHYFFIMSHIYLHHIFHNLNIALAAVWF